MRMFMRCDAHPAMGGPHKSVGVIMGPGPGGSLFVRCTHRSKRGRQCEAVQLVLPDREVKDGR